MKVVVGKNKSAGKWGIIADCRCKRFKKVRTNQTVAVQE